MTKRILIQRIAASNPQSEAAKAYDRLLRLNCDTCRNKDTEISTRLLRRGLDRLGEFAYSYLHYMNDREVFEAVLGAERDGFDAVIVYCFSDPALDEMRQAVDIPVVGLGQSAMTLASLMGSRFGLVAMAPQSIARNEQLARRYGISDRLSMPIRSLPFSLADQEKMILDSRAGIEAFRTVAREYIADGAELVIPACGALHLALKFAPGVPELPSGVTEVDGVPVVDAVSAAVKTAELLVDFKRAGIPWISRKATYSRPADDVQAQAMRKLAYSFGGVA